MNITDEVRPIGAILSFNAFGGVKAYLKKDEKDV